MGDVQVKRATVSGNRIERLVVGLDRLPDRTIDREEAIRWLRDGHSLIPVVDGVRGAALVLVELDDGSWVIRADARSEDADTLPPLPAV